MEAVMKRFQIIIIPKFFLYNVGRAIKSSDNLFLGKKSKARSPEGEASLLIIIPRISVVESNPLPRLKLLLCNQSVAEFMVFGGVF